MKSKTGSPLQQEQRLRFYTKGRLLGTSKLMRDLAIDAQTIIPMTDCLIISQIGKRLYMIGTELKVKPTGGRR